MIESIQTWLFPKTRLLPQEFDDEGYLVYFNGARRHKTLKMDDGEYIFRCQYNPKDAFTGAGRLSAAYPPLHFHRQQSEEVKVIQGRIGYILEGKDGYISEGYASKGHTLRLPMGKIHSFWTDPTSEEDVIMEFSVRPARGLDEQWIDSFYGVHNSAYQAKVPLSFLQAMVFYYEAASAPGNVPKPIGIAMAYVFGRWVGRWAGYKGIYDIYDNTTKRKLKST